MPLLTFWTITFNPSDFPGKYVLRATYVERGGMRASAACLVFDSLEDARAAVPFGAFRFERSPEDAPVIVESWMT